MADHFAREAYENHCAIDRGAHRAERVLIGTMLRDPSVIEDVLPRVIAADLDSKLNRNILDAIYAMHTDGEVPTKHAMISAWDDYQVDNIMRLSDYLTGCITESLDDLGLPIEGIVQNILDRAKRRMLEEAAHVLQLATDGKRSVADIGRKAIDHIQSILTDVGSGERKIVSAASLAEAGLACLEGSAKIGPGTGFVDLDRIIGGWPMAQLSIVAGRPGMGKSAFGLSVALNAAKQGHTVLIFSLEMTAEQIGARLLTDIAYTSMDPLRYRRQPDGMTGRHRQLIDQAMQRLSALSIEVCDRSGITVEDIAVHARMHAAELKQNGQTLDLIVVDHIGLVAPGDAYRGNRVREVAECTQGLAALAKRLDLPVVGLCQLNRAVESRDNKRPSAHDLRDSGAIEEDASLIMMLYRPAFYLERERFDDAEKERVRLDALEAARHRLEVKIEKNRNGEPGFVELFADIGSNAIRNSSFRR